MEQVVKTHGASKRLVFVEKCPSFFTCYDEDISFNVDESVISVCDSIKQHVKKNGYEIVFGPFFDFDQTYKVDVKTGGVRENKTGKGRFDLIPSECLVRLAKHFENGAKKYGENNWRNGLNLSSYVNSASRHFLKMKDGLTDEDHAAAVITNVCMFMETVNLIKEGKLSKKLDDISYFKEKS